MHRHRIAVRSEREIDCMRRAGRIVGDVLRELRDRVVPGWKTADIDRFAETYIRDRNALPSFKGYRGFPHATCVCLNHELVHGMPSDKRAIEAGDLVKIDVGACYRNWHADASLTVGIEPLADCDRQLVRVTEMALTRGLAAIRPGVTLQVVSSAIQDWIESQGFYVPRHYIGHGIGRNLHEYPPVPNYRSEALPNPTLQAGMTLAIEPIVLARPSTTHVLPDGWTVASIDRVRSAQCEHTIAVVETGCDILTALQPH
ncbi:MAG: type I methionyl aminopeptidase [Cyanobacteria bacterium P01_F01_bin.33]